MRKIVTLLLTIAMFMSLGITAFASENPTEIDVYARVIRTIEGEFVAEVQNGTAETILDDGTSVSVANAPNDAVMLMVVPVPKTETEAWNWITACVKKIANPVHTFDIYFMDSRGERLDADGAVVTLNCPHGSGVPVVCSLDTDGTVHVLTPSSQARMMVVTFTTNGSSYYVMGEKALASETEDDYDDDYGYEDDDDDDAPVYDVIVDETTGGNVGVSDRTPKAGDLVVISSILDNGKEVDKVIVTDQNGTMIPVTDNGDGTYTYKQPKGNVKVDFVLREMLVEDGGLTVTVLPKTGDDSKVQWWLFLVAVSMMGLYLLLAAGRREDAE